MADYDDVERLRRQNTSLLRKLQEAQSDLKRSVSQSTKSHAPSSSSDAARTSSSSTSRAGVGRLGYLPARSSSPPTRDVSPLPSRHFSTSIGRAVAASTEQITSTPKQLPSRVRPNPLIINRTPRMHATPTHRSRTEILDTDPQELLTASCNVDVNRSSYSLRLGPRQDDGFSRKVPSRLGHRQVDGFSHKVPSRLGHRQDDDFSRKTPSRASAQKRKLQLRKEQRRSERQKLGVKRRKSPRNVSVVKAPGERPSHTMMLAASGKRHRVLNESVKNMQRSATPSRRHAQSTVALEPSPRQQRYNLRRPHTATPKFGQSRELEHESPQNMPSQYRSEFLNSYYARQEQENMEDIRVPISGYTGRLLDGGNARSPRRPVVMDTTPKPKSILLTPANKSVRGRNGMHVSFQDSPNTSASLRRDNPNVSSSSGHVQPLLGYDWIAGLLDADGHGSERTEGYLAELQEFRRNNYEDCVHKSVMEGPDSEMNISHQSNRGPASATDGEGTGKSHKCIHNYTLNDRLFPVPLHGTETGESLCALCNARRPVDFSTDSQSYVRVSVPRSTLRSPYQVRPHRRKSFDPTDSIGLSHHCLAGWENSVPSMMPAASNIDLKDSLGYSISQSQSLFMDREDITGQPARARRPLAPSDETQQLLNRSRSMRLELQKLERSGLSKGKTANRSQYPLL